MDGTGAVTKVDGGGALEDQVGRAVADVAAELRRDRFSEVPAGVVVCATSTGSTGLAGHAAGVLAAAGVPARLAGGCWTLSEAGHVVRATGSAMAVVVTPAGVVLLDSEGRVRAAAAHSGGPVDSDPGSFLVLPAHREATDAYLDKLAGRLAAAGDAAGVLLTGPEGAARDAVCEVWQRAGLGRPEVLDGEGACGVCTTSDEALAEADRRGARLVLGVDVDGVSLSVAVHHGDWWHTLGADEVCGLVAERSLSRGDVAAVRTGPCSSPLAGRVERRWGAASSGAPGDAVAGAVEMVALWAEMDGRGRDVVEALEAVRRRYGTHLSRSRALGSTTVPAMPSRLAGLAVLSWGRSRRDGSDTVVVELEGGSRVCVVHGADGLVRTVHAAGPGDTEVATGALLDQLERAVDDVLGA